MKSLLQIRKRYQQSLSGRYTEREIDTIFYALAETFLHQNKTMLKLGLHELREEQDIKSLLFESGLFRLVQGMPYQYVLGNTEFFGCKILVNPNVLIPRPETEELVEWILQNIENKNQEINIIDLCSGSGCIAVALAKNLPNAQITGLEINEKAIATALTNAEINQVKINFIQDDLLNLQHDFDQKFDIIVSNPPYIQEFEKADMNENVLHFEPQEALFVPNDNPLIFYQKIIDFSQKYLKKSEKIYAEINQKLGKETMELFSHYFKNTMLKKDISGNERIIKAEELRV
ncbi:MAG: peptide chain release factor N(5)-glutamine methyltransferase [Flavobacteriaceae bacterium]|jgi:release factor glutamine methyltransferase|nr:peptide chain release factor N(5)-glutamine methyltransferase [Flavobacteriaceae bacterium]